MFRGIGPVNVCYYSRLSAFCQADFWKKLYFFRNLRKSVKFIFQCPKFPLPDRRQRLRFCSLKSCRAGQWYRCWHYDCFAVGSAVQRWSDNPSAVYTGRYHAFSLFSKEVQTKSRTIPLLTNQITSINKMVKDCPNIDNYPYVEYYFDIVRKWTISEVKRMVS